MLGIPVLVIILAVVVAAGWVLLNRTTFGRRTVAVGGNPEAARLAGINVRLHTTLLYALSGLCCGIGAIMLTAQATSAQAAMANLYELDAIAALAGDRKLRPTELSFLYRLAGPPMRLRRTYRLVPSLTDREREAIDRIEQLREVAPVVRYERYIKAERPRAERPR